uniref:Large ribosomal subunit protein uL13 n=1 Tax=Myxobolus squamalis TaxID=59785 RepID=A0A6B2G8I9_MYXSQ
MGKDKKLIIDGENHLLGRLSSIIAKQLLLGKRIVVLRCEGICMSGKYKRMEYKYKMYLRKRVNTNPKKGPFHHRCPTKMLIKSVRGMLPSRTERGKLALLNLSCFVGVPPLYATKKKMIIPQASRILCLHPSNPYNKLKRLAKNFGWKYADVTERLEEKRKSRGTQYRTQKLIANSLINKAKARAAERLAPLESKLRDLGYAC